MFAATDDEVFSRGLLDAYSGALSEIARGRDHRPILMEWLGRAFSAHAAGHVRVRVEASRSDLCLWRKESEDVASTINFSMPDVIVPAQLEQTWYACAARRFVLDWFESGYMSEMPVVADAEGFAVVLVGTRDQLDDRGMARLQEIRRHFEAIERGRLREMARVETAPQPPSTAAPPLTMREIEVLRMLGDGLLARTIALRLGVSERTIHKHLGNLYAKLGVHDRLLAVRKAETLGLIAPGVRTDAEAG